MHDQHFQNSYYYIRCNKYQILYKSQKELSLNWGSIAMEYQGKIKISVGEPAMITDSTISYVTYLISGVDHKGGFSIKRRYKDFFLLRQKLVERWPGLYIPSISSKKATGNTDQRFVASRKKSLNTFCVKICEREYLFSSEPFQIFLRNDADYESAIKTLQPVEYQNISTVYEKNFTELSLNLSSSELQISVEADFLFLKASEKKLEKLRDSFKAVVDSKEQYDSLYNSVIGKTMGEYEQKFLLRYIEGDRSKLFLKSNDQFNQQLKHYRDFTKNNLIEDYVELISTQLRQMRAFREAIEGRKKAEQFRTKLQSRRKDGIKQFQKLKAGKTTVKSVFSAGSKEQQIKQLEDNVEKWQKLQQTMSNIIFLMNACIYTEIEQYKKNRLQQYYKQVRIMNRKQIKQMAEYGRMLSVVLKDSKDIHISEQGMNTTQSKKQQQSSQQQRDQQQQQM